MPPPAEMLTGRAPEAEASCAQGATPSGSAALGSAGLRDGPKRGVASVCGESNTARPLSETLGVSGDAALPGEAAEGVAQRMAGEVEEEGGADQSGRTYDCAVLLANAPVAGDTYSWYAVLAGPSVYSQS